ncbi:PREDICTED: immune-associated nucleotide-binding protein 8-like isoform X2 [Nelumbo nucifera]|uniref:Immune-associated nucleotide-binding protein 8-like isoform X2 n=2 Tax=Nelumbo nucifera TaxID=4432 RepID=A0A1U8AKI4_NELNU|nr:PREDICTED: immune-associated nucleotide-binding protein 8-like isoform X2 [Nelumbo nucifera]DAD29024.1 TPA_asm: hypothetical protein HUJ06_030492 [Nelumbo nucifera]
MATASPNNITMVLVGRSGDGKSATGNSILKRKAFKTVRSSSSVRSTTEMQSSVLQDGRTVNVIDTPGLFDFSDDSTTAEKEIAKCINLAKNGIHAMLLVYSVSTRFSEEEEAAIRVIKGLFGQKIADYMIIVFTGGDLFDDDADKEFQDYLAECPKPFQEILQSCKHRVVLFDNKTKDENKRNLQVSKLLSLVDKVIKENGGRPYINEPSIKLQESEMQGKEKEEAESKVLTGKKISIMQEEVHKPNDEKLYQVKQMVGMNSRDKPQTEQDQSRIAPSNAVDREKSREEIHQNHAPHSGPLTEMAPYNFIPSRMASPNNITMVLLGRTGNGKSSTGNSILKRNAFKSQHGFNSVGKTTEMQSSVLQDGKTVNVIDTPGLFDFSVDSATVEKEIVKCIDLAKNGIHAMLLVCCAFTRFSKEEEAAIQVIKDLFGQKITEYMIIVFTGGDLFEDDDADKEFQDYLAECPKPFQEILQLCKHRVVLFDNKTKDENKCDLQVRKLLFLVDNVINENGGKPYTNEHFIKLQKEIEMQCEQKVK